MITDKLKLEPTAALVMKWAMKLLRRCNFTCDRRPRYCTCVDKLWISYTLGPEQPDEFIRVKDTESWGDVVFLYLLVAFWKCAVDVLNACPVCRGLPGQIIFCSSARSPAHAVAE